MAYPLPSSSGSILDGGLGVLPEDTTQTSFKVGVCSSGTSGTLYTFRGTNTSSVVSTLGTGPLADATIHHLLKSGGKTVYAYKAASSVAGSNSAVDQSGSGPLPTLSGTADDYKEYVVRIVVGGAVATATFVLSDDGGDTYGEETATVASYATGSGVSILFTAGTYVADEVYSFTATPAAMNTTNIGDALDAIIDLPLEASFVHVVGTPADAATAASITALLQTKMDNALAAHKPMFAMHEGAMASVASHITAYSAVSARWVMAALGCLELINDRTSKIEKRSAGRPLAARIARNPISVDIQRDVGDSVLDPLSGVSALVPQGDDGSTGYVDFAVTSSANSSRFAGCMTFVGRQGYYPANGNMMASSGSDFGLVQFVRIVLRASSLFYQWSLDNLSQRIRKDPTTGYILPAVAKALEDDASEFLRAGVGAHVDGIQVTINRSDDLSADPTLRYAIRLVGPAYAKSVEFELGLVDSLPELAA